MNTRLPECDKITRVDADLATLSIQCVMKATKHSQCICECHSEPGSFPKLTVYITSGCLFVLLVS